MEKNRGIVGYIIVPLLDLQIELLGPKPNTEQCEILSFNPMQIILEMTQFEKIIFPTESISFNLKRNQTYV